MSIPELVMVPANQTVADLVDDYAEGVLSYGDLLKEFASRGWSTLSLYENVRHIKVKGKDT